MEKRPLLTIGQKIKRIRKMRGITQKELAVRSGLTIGQIKRYEEDSRTPKGEVIQKLSSAMDVSELALVTDLSTKAGLLHLLFELEDVYDAEIRSIDGTYSIVFKDTKKNKNLISGLKRWEQAKLAFDGLDNNEYELWKAHFGG